MQSAASQQPINHHNFCLYIKNKLSSQLSRHFFDVAFMKKRRFHFCMIFLMSVGCAQHEIETKQVESANNPQSASSDQSNSAPAYPAKSTESNIDIPAQKSLHGLPSNNIQPLHEPLIVAPDRAPIPITGALAAVPVAINEHDDEEECHKNTDCNDDNNCTEDSCQHGKCVNVAILGCAPCLTATDCSDNDVCTTEECVNGICKLNSIPGCATCTTASDCIYANSCLLSSCVAETCIYTAVLGCASCTTSNDCNDNNPCTSDACINQRCSNPEVEGCASCTAPSDCNDNNPCTTDQCNCVHAPCDCTTAECTCSNPEINGCSSCTMDNQCSAGGPCVSGSCGIDMTCEYAWISGCCVSNSDCSGGAPCTTPTCSSSQCTYPTNPSCVPCISASDCPAQTCQTASCNNFECSYSPIPGCCTTASDCPSPPSCEDATCINNVCGTKVRVCTNSCPTCFRPHCNLILDRCDCQGPIPGCIP